MSEQREDPKTKRILVVDDEEDLLEVYSIAIGRQGFQVETATDGFEAMRKIDASPPDLMILDLMLPRVGGFEVIMKLRQENKARIPIIVISGRYTDAKTQEAMRNEPDVVEFLVKPIRPGALMELIHRTLNTEKAA